MPIEYLFCFIVANNAYKSFRRTKSLKEPSREKPLLTLHVVTEMHFLLPKNLKNIMHGRVKLYVMR